MPLFESQESRNRRLFRAVGQVFIDKAHQLLEDEYDSIVESAWIMGGQVAAQAMVKHSPSLRKAWSKGDEEKARSLIEIFTLPMIFAWYEALDAIYRPSEDDQRRAFEIAVHNNLTIFGNYSENTLKDCMNIYAQLRRRKEILSRGGVPWWDSMLLLSKAVVACGGPETIDWSRQTFPIELSSDVVTVSGSPLPFSPNDLQAWIGGLYGGTKAMFYYHEEMCKVCGITPHRQKGA